jgi:sec-independent protein translocase protein TatA
VNIGPFQIVIILLVVLVLFGRGRISETMGDFGKGIKSFKKGMTDEEPAKPAQRIEGPADEVKSDETKSTTDKTAN